MEEKLKIYANDIEFKTDGSVLIKNAALKESLESIFNAADVVACTTNNGCGNEVNAGSCGKANIKCAQSIFSRDDVAFSGTDEINIKNPDFIGELTRDKLKGFEKDEVNLLIKGFKSI